MTFAIQPRLLINTLDEAPRNIELTVAGLIDWHIRPATEAVESRRQFTNGKFDDH
jgi:hypothetical protein